MKRLMLFLTAFFCVQMIGCGKPVSEEEVVGNKSTSVGPFNLELSSETVTKANVFSIDISQNDGAVDFFIQNGASLQYLVLDSTDTKVTGCSATAVQVTPVWYDSETSTSPDLLEEGMTMITTPNVRSKLRILFAGLGGCKHLDFSLVVRRLEVGVLQPRVDPELAGSWSFGNAPDLTISLLVDSSRVGWLEGIGRRFTCDTEMYPSSSLEPGGGMLCHYQFETSAHARMKLNCHGRNYYGCTIPKNLSFVRR